MNITVGFIALFISIVIPGLLFLRFYYYGEFLKQFTTKEPILNSLLFAIIPGLIVQSIAFLVYCSITNNSIELSKILSVHRNLLSDNDFTDDTTKFLDNYVLEFVGYSVLVFLLSMALGALSSRTIRLLKLDRRTRMFRFRNQWFYIFSGQVFSFNKFKKAVTILNKPDLKKKNVDMVFADVLISSAGKTKLYTGFVVDYDLDNSDTSKLEKIYLLDAHRYKHSEIDDPTSTSGKQSTVEKKAIPGSVFILPVKDLVNINLLYVTSEKKIKQLDKSERKLSQYTKPFVGLILIVLFLLSFYLFKKATWFSFSLYENYFAKTNFFDKIIAFLAYMQILSILVPKKEKDGSITYFHDMGAKAIAFGLMIVVFIAFNFKWLF